MKGESLKKQAAVTAVSGALVRGLGLGLRFWMSRALGPEAMGVMELAMSAHALAVTPGAAGLPGAVSRLAARARTEKEEGRVLRTGRRMALTLGLGITLAFLALSPWIARWLGDERTLPALMLFAPCALLTALSGVYDGMFYGRGRALPPNLSQLGEQGVRMLLFVPLSLIAARLTPAGRAAGAAAGVLLGETAGLAVVAGLARMVPRAGASPEDGVLRRRMVRLALPLTVNRLAHAGLRALCSAVIPLRLTQGGLDHREAMSRLGMLNGMVMPLVFLPGLVAGALAAVAGPGMARCRTREAERKLAGKTLLLSAGTGVACGGLLYALSPWLASGLYRLPELTTLIRFACPLAPVLAVQQTLSGLMTGLGMQKKALAASLPGGALTLALTWLWTARAGLPGAVLASLLGHGLTLIWCLTVIWGRLRRNDGQFR